MAETRIACSGCGATVDPAETLPFRCPNAADGDGTDHVLVRSVIGADTALPDAGDPAGANPFVRYRARLTAYHLARRLGLDDDAFVAIAEELDAAIARVDGAGFRVTPFAPAPALAAACGLPADAALWVKDETANVSGSHKARHLMGVMLYLRVLERAGAPLGAGLRGRRLAIASCGNAALAAAVIARAADWPIDVFIPPDAEAAVTARLAELGATLNVMHRRPGQAGDPCYHGFRAAVRAGGLPFGVQGNEVGLAIEGGETLGWEMAEVLARAGTAVDMLAVQVGGGALASACHAGFAEAAPQPGAVPRLFTVQTAGAWPLKKAFDRFMAESRGGDMDEAVARAARNRADYMRPWPEEPKSVAHGILDDETYDWLALVRGMAATDGDALVVGEERLRDANRIARAATGIAVSHTGSAGLAGLMELVSGHDARGMRAAVLFTGAERA